MQGRIKTDTEGASYGKLFFGNVGGQGRSCGGLPIKKEREGKGGGGGGGGRRERKVEKLVGWGGGGGGGGKKEKGQDKSQARVKAKKKGEKGL